MTPPAGVVGEVHSRFRLDYGEDAGSVADLSGTLLGEFGTAQFGEVEDHLLPEPSQYLGLLAGTAALALLKRVRRRPDSRRAGFPAAPPPS